MDAWLRQGDGEEGEDVVASLISDSSSNSLLLPCVFFDLYASLGSLVCRSS